ncbi:serine/threonine-protein phosphatase [Croceicoccus ponticola]|uniref:Serine/threonine-protein phosphatase n=1 Tax=Croceicoccus ponticola TaxID=2217664 RepID=A0A437GX28_9SPHN|nr:protein phosphatase 2C domain-containing protein [Croceicoccus ponticola]RVQ66953.1 serine/threonine-protein phosphatase [Croceicoccus ponticola]
MSPKFLSACQTNVGLRRKANEDNYLDRSNDGIWIVADGMGGHDAGEVASAMIIEAMRGISAGPDPKRTAQAAMDAIQAVQVELVELARDGVKPRTIGSTVVGLVIASGQYVCFWVGDSRILLVRDGAITRLTRDHSLVQDLIDAGLLAPADAEAHPDSNVITRAVGADKELVIDSASGTVKQGDLFLLASDGVTKVMAEEEMLQLLSTRNAKQATSIMGEMILERGAPDNFTSIVVRIL